MRPLSGFPSGHREIEIKIAITNVTAMKRKLRTAGFSLVRRRIHEWNQLYDFPDARLRRTGDALRLRRAGNVASVTYKGKRRLTLGMKDREEIETTVSDAGAAAMVFERLGLRPTFAYEKYRTTYGRGKLAVVVDETPIGDFVEIEGDPARILRAARRLGYSDSDFITESYVELYRKRHRGDMVFKKELIR
ncbi:MAG: class IV adenylate cyclase [Acidobacteria bacterium]|nr:class IV adenylate cyclase [Acidobacteriota bacterium]